MIGFSDFKDIGNSLFRVKIFEEINLESKACIILYLKRYFTCSDPVF